MRVYRKEIYDNIIFYEFLIYNFQHATSLENKKDIYTDTASPLCANSNVALWYMSTQLCVWELHV